MLRFLVKEIVLQVSQMMHVTSLHYIIKVTGDALNIEYYFWWRAYCFGLLIHEDGLFYFIVSIRV